MCEEKERIQLESRRVHVLLLFFPRSTALSMPDHLGADFWTKKSCDFFKTRFNQNDAFI